MKKIDIKTADGVCPAYVFTPEGEGPWPAVLMYMDIFGVRPAAMELAERLASNGYYVLQPDLMWRLGDYGPLDPAAVFADSEKRKALFPAHLAAASPAHVMSDTRAFLDAIAADPDARDGPIGAVGYCLGGRLALTAAGTYPDAFAAVASYHAGGLVTEDPYAPVQLAGKMQARLYIGGAKDDASFTDDMKAALDVKFREAGLDYVIETYDAQHGWVYRDFPVHDAAATERHWQTLTALFGDVLKS
ncbi:dienelactone hydrolase family protein [Solimonas marina]|uniref:Dienelactone hydrolase family protein n=1 Tax=Solimonas marina TaxID=2714601 RepID=A0A969WAU1_9GAMM|nr:dienelactone hydrolase family protein [Solimonas marina]NKF22096.1 dienelactone hydrolase family protein [Solimonas marina]